MESEYFMINEETGKMVEILPIDKICTILKMKIQHYEDRLKHLKEEKQKLESEKWESEELQKMKEQMKKYKEDYARGFPISKEEYEKIVEWKDKHEKEKHSQSNIDYSLRDGAIGGSYSYIFTPTRIGVFKTIKCTCGESFTFAEDL